MPSNTLLRLDLILLTIVLTFACATVWIHIISSLFREHLTELQRKQTVRKMLNNVLKTVKENKKSN